MLFQIIVLVILLLLTAYLVTQGWFSATLVFISAAFASILAGALYEPLSGFINGHFPDYGHGVTFLMLFFLAFSALRIAADMFIKGNIKLQVWVDRAGAVVVGLLTSLIIVGTTVIGIEMLPFPQAIMNWHGWDRYPDGNRTNSDDSRLPENKLWLNPDGFVTWMYEMTLGRSLGGSYGGDYTFAQAHPDLGEELWGYRHRAKPSSIFAMPNSVMDPPVAWLYSEKEKTTAPDAEKTWTTDKNRYVVRMRVRKGSEAPMVSTDRDLFFRATPSQIRLVAIDSAGNAIQAYPVGFLSHGDRFVAWGDFASRPIKGKLAIEPLVMPYSIEDYTISGNAGEQVTVDWAFSLPFNFKPAFLEVKSLARQNVEIADAKPVIDIAQYPPRKFLEKTFACSVQMRDNTSPIKQHKVYIVAANAKRAVFKSFVGEVAQKLESEKETARNKPDPGVPSWDQINQYAGASRDVDLKNENTDLNWSSQIMISAPWAGLSLLNGASNHTNVSRFLDEKITPLILDSRVDHTVLTTNDAGKAPVTPLAEGDYTIIAWYLTTDHVYVWYRNIDAKGEKACTFILTTGTAAQPTNELKECAPDFTWPQK
jgi:hypothetical protein